MKPNRSQWSSRIRRLFLHNPKSKLSAFIFILISVVCASLGVPSQFDYKGWIVLCTIALMFISMLNDLLPSHFSMLMSLCVMMFTQVVTTSEALSGFSSSAVLSVAVLYVVAAGLTDTGALNYFMNKLLGSPTSLASAQLRLLLPTSIISAFLNNTPVVAIMIPITQHWAARMRLPPSQLFIPLSFASILGGTCTLIGTSTNLVVAGRALEDLNMQIGLFDLGVVGVPVLLTGACYVILFAPFLLPGKAEIKRRRLRALNMGIPPANASSSRENMSTFEKLKRDLSFGGVKKLDLASNSVKEFNAEGQGCDKLNSLNSEISDDTRDLNSVFGFGSNSDGLTFACYVEDTSPVVDKSLVDAKLRGLSGLFLTSVLRKNNLLQAIGPEFVVASGDILYFTGIVDNFTEFCRDHGFVPVTSENEDQFGNSDRALTPGLSPTTAINESSRNSIIQRSVLDLKRGRSSTLEGHLIRARVKNDGDLAAKTPKDVNFRKRYKAAILSVYRRGQKLDTRGNLGRTILLAGDELVILNSEDFSWDDELTRRDLELVSCDFDVEPTSSSLPSHVSESVKPVSPIKGEQNSLEKEFIFSMKVSDSSGLIGARSLVGETIESAGLRGLPGLFLIALEREGCGVKRAVGSDELLQKDDILWFVGERNSVAVLRRIPGLVLPNEKQVDKLLLPKVQRRLVECVISLNSDMIGKTIRETKFRSRYRAAVIAVHREGQRVLKKIGDIMLRPGDVLILDTGPYFIQRFRDDSNFLLVAEVEDSGVPQFGKFYIALFAVVGMMVLYTTLDSLGGKRDISVSLFECACLASGIMLFFNILSPQRAMSSINWEVIITVACAFGISNAMEKAKVAEAIGTGLVNLAKITNTGETGLLAAVYLATFLLSIVIANNAAALLMFPISIKAITALTDSEESLTKVLFILMLAASSSFSSPFGYQTNLMVYGPGNYIFLDYLKFGMPMQIWQWVFSVVFVAAIKKWYISWAASIIGFLLVVGLKLYGYSAIMRNLKRLCFAERKLKEKYSTASLSTAASLEKDHYVDSRNKAIAVV